jgi:type I site-specific restriction endonuclease
VPLKFQREGIKYDGLTEEEKEQWDAVEWSDDGTAPQRVEAEAVNKWLFNKDTVDKVLEHLMTRGQTVAGGDRLGKTIIFAKMAAHPALQPALILAHRDELIQQAVEKLHLVDPTLALGIVQATRDEHTAPTVVASVQTLSRRTRLTRLVPDFQTIVIDEAHHAPAPTYRRILDYCRAWAPNGPLVVGVTATPERGDRQSLREVFDRIVYQKTLLEMMQAGYLVDLRALQVLLQADFDALRKRMDDTTAHSPQLPQAAFNLSICCRSSSSPSIPAVPRPLPL